MKAYPLFGAGIFFLVSVVPQPSSAQTPTAKAAALAAKNVPRFMWHFGEGVTIDPALEWRGHYFGGKIDKFKFPPFKDMWDRLYGPAAGAAGGVAGCNYFEWCPKQK